MTLSTRLPPVIECRELVKAFGPRRVLNGVELVAAPGEWVTVIGANGAGKTTLLRILATLSRPTSGLVRILGLELKEASARIRRHIGFLSHQTLLYDDLTPEQNLRFYARMYELADSEERIRELLERLGLLQRRHEPVRTLSKGMQQRLALARAVLHRPAVLLLDEPYAGLDARSIQMVTTLLAEMAEQGHTILLTTHSAGLAPVVGGRVAVLERGRLHWEG
ncbi:MAG: heme ABC exporter ATP-binding protein CcmA [Anaerolineae bacterium]|nr:heme ABC exporter ATP-binding protein CcmA [Anaerolineae bacterium]